MNNHVQYQKNNKRAPRHAFCFICPYMQIYKHLSLFRERFVKAFL